MKLRPGAAGRLGASPVALPAVVALVAVATWSVGAPPAKGPEAADAAFSAARAIEHVEAISQEPHAIGTAAIARVRSYLISELKELGLNADLQQVVAPDYYGPGNSDVTLVNVAARIEGHDSTRAVALMAHYDTFPETPGANDNSAAVATLLEVARATLAGPQLRNDVILLFTDGEEPAPRYGAAGFVDSHRWLNEVGFIVNLEAIGSSGPSLLLEVSGPQRSIVDAFSDAASHPAAYSFLGAVVDLMGGADTDFAPFREAGVSGLNFAYLRGSPIYHTMEDTPDTVDLKSLQHHGLHSMAAVQRFGSMDLVADMADGRSVYFTLGRRLVVSYSLSWSLPLVALAMVAVGGALYRRHKHVGTARPFLVGFGLGLLYLGGVFIAAALAWRVVVAVRPRPGIGESYFYLTAILGLAAAGYIRMADRLDRGRVDIVFGSVAVWLLLAIATGLWMQGAAYLFVWPTLVGGAVLWAADGSRHRSSKLGMLAVAVVAICLMTPAVDIFFQFAQPRPGNPESQLLETVGLPVVLALMVVTLLHAVWPQRAAAS